jgi:hypothetical protein
MHGQHWECQGGGVNKTYYWDSDNDRYGDENSTIQSCAPPSRWVEQGGDCCDADSRVRPDQTQPQDEVSQCQTWDFNCDKHAEVTGYSTAVATCSYQGDRDCFKANSGWKNTPPECGTPSAYFDATGSCGTTVACSIEISQTATPMMPPCL